MVFVVLVENGRPLWQAGSFALVVAFLAVFAVVVLDTVAGRRVVRIAVHVFLGLFVLIPAFLLTVLQLADRFLTAPAYVFLAGLWVVSIALLLNGVLVYRGTPRLERRVATVGLGVTLALGVAAIGYVAFAVVSGALNIGSDVTAGEVSGWVFLVVLVTLPSIVFRWDLRETRPAGQNEVDER
ncbi:hypothetical protein SAMN04487948_11571 [Halogranum amylolyticum]|uniref:Uncharacterized protein n=1 Tax=Halogranum amylolyticum TaxID=660520 RepID=A0A1H8VBK8_9EURY|nr:hypothetical protein [Halogranum amylolyticum]SEP12852.1 hypothetical protein SAMN04487948_11571 [Halogranum amylolyticum]